MTPDSNITFGFTWLCVGLLMGAPMALSFLRPDWLGGYGSMDRRLLRLSHVAFIMLSLLNVIYGYAMKTGAVQPSWQSVISLNLVLGAILLPLVLLAGVWIRRALWLLPVPFLQIFVAALFAAAGRWK